MRRARYIFVLLSMLGCDIDTRSDAERDCLDFRETLCDAMATCAGDRLGLSSAQEQDFYDDCIEDGTDSLDCSRAVSVESSFDQCLDDLPKRSCSLLTSSSPLPFSCQGVINVR